MSKDLNEIKIDDRYHLGNHRFRVTQTVANNWDKEDGPVVYLSCAPQCCTTPYNIKIQCVAKSLKELGIKKGWPKRNVRQTNP